MSVKNRPFDRAGRAFAFRDEGGRESGERLDRDLSCALSKRQHAKEKSIFSKHFDADMLLARLE